MPREKNGSEKITGWKAPSLMPSVWIRTRGEWPEKEAQWRYQVEKPDEAMVFERGGG